MGRSSHLTIRGRAVALVAALAALASVVASVTFVTALVAPVSAVTALLAPVAVVIAPVAVVLDARPGVASGSVGAALGGVATVLLDTGPGPVAGTLSAGLGAARGVAAAVVLAVGLDTLRLAGAGPLGTGVGVVSGLYASLVSGAGPVGAGLGAVRAVGLGTVALDAGTVQVTAPLGAFVGVVLTVSGDTLVDRAAGHVCAAVLAGRRGAITPVAPVSPVALAPVASVALAPVAPVALAPVTPVAFATVAAVAFAPLALAAVAFAAVTAVVLSSGVSTMLDDALAHPVTGPLDAGVGVVLAIFLDALVGESPACVGAAVGAIRRVAVVRVAVSTMGGAALAVERSSVSGAAVSVVVRLDALLVHRPSPPGTAVLAGRLVGLRAMRFDAFGGKATTVSDAALLFAAVFDAGPHRVPGPSVARVLAGRRGIPLIRASAQLVDVVGQRRVRALLLTRREPKRQEQRQRPHNPAMKMHRVPPFGSSWRMWIATTVPAPGPRTWVHALSSRRDTAMSSVNGSWRWCIAPGLAPEEPDRR